MTGANGRSEHADAAPTRPEALSGGRLGRVVFVTPSFSAGGAERVTVTFANGLADAGCDVQVIVLSEEGPLRSSLDSLVSVEDLARPRVRSAMPALLRALRQRDPATVIVSAAHVAWGLLVLRPLLPRSLRVVVRTANLPSLHLPLTRFPRLFAMLNRYLIPRAHLNVASSRRMRDELIGCGVRPGDIWVVPNPVDAASIRAAADPLQRVDGPGRRFVAVGRLVHQKGFDRLIDVLRSLDPDDHCLVVGDGPLRGELEKRAQAAGLGEQFRLMGFTDNPWTWMAGADALLMPSRTEGLPNVALEALACGTPVVATAESGGIGEIAEQAPKAVVTILPIGGFAGHLESVPAVPPSSLRRSLLPEAYLAANAVNSLSAAIEGRAITKR